MINIKCPNELNQFLLGMPIFENTFSKEDCKLRKFYGDCHHCFSTAIANRDNQSISSMIKKIKLIVDEWQSDTWSDNISYECMIKISEIVNKGVKK